MSSQHVSWRLLAGLCCVFPLLSLVLMFCIPESPAWLVTQGNSFEIVKLKLLSLNVKFDCKVLRFFRKDIFPKVD